MDDVLVRSIGYGLTLAITPLVVRAAARLFPARGDRVHLDDSKRFSRITALGTVMSLAAMWVAIFALIYLRFPNSPWIIAYAFGWLTGPYLLVVAVATLPSGIATWRDYWCYQAHESGMSHRFVPAILCAVSLLGLVATIILYAHRNA